MTKPLFFAANWKMNIGPSGAREFMDRFLAIDTPVSGRTVGFFPPAVSIEATQREIQDRDDMVVGTQDVYWESDGAFTGQNSVSLASEAGAGSVLVGHSERRHIFNESDEQTALKTKAVLSAGLQVVLCVGETLEEREAGITVSVVERQLTAALTCVDPEADLVIAYEPVWAIGTGKVATPEDANTVHLAIRGCLESLGLSRDTRILYGGSVKLGNVVDIVAQPEVNGVLVGGASLDPESWGAICATEV